MAICNSLTSQPSMMACSTAAPADLSLYEALDVWDIASTEHPPAPDLTECHSIVYLSTLSGIWRRPAYWLYWM